MNNALPFNKLRKASHAVIDAVKVGANKVQDNVRGLGLLIFRKTATMPSRVKSARVELISIMTSDSTKKNCNKDNDHGGSSSYSDGSHNKNLDKSNEITCKWKNGGRKIEDRDKIEGTRVGWGNQPTKNIEVVAKLKNI